MPKPVTAKVAAAVRQALEDPAVKKKLEELRVEVEYKGRKILRGT
jgi:tripartite-type tricarboxylate transporter receptor subunit TctC